MGVAANDVGRVRPLRSVFRCRKARTASCHSRGLPLGPHARHHGDNLSATSTHRSTQSAGRATGNRVGRSGTAGNGLGRLQHHRDIDLLPCSLRSRLSRPTSRVSRRSSPVAGIRRRSTVSFRSRSVRWTLRSTAASSVGWPRHARDGRSGRTGQPMLACRLFEEQFSTERWPRLARRGATPQRLVWDCTVPDLEPDHAQRYVDALRVPNTVQVLSASAVAALNGRGLGAPAPGIDTAQAAGILSALAARHIDLDDVAAALERQTSRLAQDSRADALDRLIARSGQR